MDSSNSSAMHPPVPSYSFLGWWYRSEVEPEVVEGARGAVVGVDVLEVGRLVDRDPEGLRRVEVHHGGAVGRAARLVVVHPAVAIGAAQHGHAVERAVVAVDLDARRGVDRAIPAAGIAVRILAGR